MNVFGTLQILSLTQSLLLLLNPGSTVLAPRTRRPPTNRPPKILPMATFNYGGSDDEPDAGFEVLNPSPTASSESCSIHLSPLQKWDNYFQKGTLQDHQRLCVDLGLPGDLPSKTKCRNASQRMSRT